MKKKILAVFLAVMMLTAAAVPAYAEDITKDIDVGNSDITAEGGYSTDLTLGAYLYSEEDTEAGNVYSVTLDWSFDETSFSINPSTYTWNPETLKYEFAAQGQGLSENSAESVTGTLTITNRSNATISYVITPTAGTDVTLSDFGLTSDFGGSVDEETGEAEGKIESAVVCGYVNDGRSDNFEYDRDGTGRICIDPDGVGEATSDVYELTATFDGSAYTSEGNNGSFYDCEDMVLATLSVKITPAF